LNQPTNRINALLKILENEPNDEFSLYALALEYRSVNDDISAINMLDKLVINHPKYLPAYYILAELLTKHDAFYKAIQIAKEGKQLALAQKNMKTAGELQTLIDMWSDD